jgi:hypothetical protein
VGSSIRKETRVTDAQVNRRTLVVSGAAALAAFGLAARPGSAAMVVQSGGGIAGGGSIQADGGPAEFSVFGSRFAVEGSDELIFVGSLSYNDVVAKQIIESLSVSAYGPVEGSEATTRQMSGTCTINGEGVHPFNAILTDGGPIGSGADMFELAVGADGATEVGDAIYEVQSSVQSGNLQLIDFNFSSSEASPTPAG